jgi:hypothetical protein
MVEKIVLLQYEGSLWFDDNLVQVKTTLRWELGNGRYRMFGNVINLILSELSLDMLKDDVNPFIGFREGFFDRR